MKKIIWLVLLIAPLLPAKELALNEKSQAEAALYMDFLKAVQLEKQEDPQACLYYKKAFEQVPESKYLRRILLFCSLQQGQIQEADKYADYITMGENDADDLAVYAFYQWRKGQLSQAREYYEKSLEKAPENLQVFYQYVLLLSFFDIDLAIEKMEERKVHFPGMEHVVYHEIGNIYQSKKQFSQALAYYQKATQINPNYPAPYLARAEMYERSSQFFLMLHELEELEKLGYESSTMFSRMGSVYIIVKDDNRAKYCFAKAKELDNGDIPANHFLALFAEEAKDFEAAARCVRDSADFQQKASKWYQVAFYEKMLGREKEALETLKEAYQLFEKNVEVGYFYALALQDAKKYRKAAQVLEGILQTNPNYQAARLSYAFTLESLKKYKQMEEQIRLLLQENPKNAAAYNLLGFSLAERGQRLGEAEQLVIKALEINPSDMSFVDSLAWVYYKQGKHEQALKLFLGIDETFVKENKEVAYHLGAAYLKNGQMQQAKKYLEYAADERKEAKKLLKQIR